MNKIYLKLIFCNLVAFGCVSPQMVVTNIQNNQNLVKSTQIYALPRTVISIDVVFQKQVYIPGPYHEFADKYLAIKGVTHEPYESWNIAGLSVESISEPDPGYFYAINTDKPLKKIDDNLKAFESEGLILLPESNLLFGPFSSVYPIPVDDIYFKDLSVKRNLLVEKSTEYKRVLRDSMYVQVPFETEMLKTKTTEQKAEEAANFIIKLRKRKFKLLTGQNEGPVSGEIQAYIDELNRIEAAYLSLFTGKITADTIQKKYEYIPVSEKKSDKQILFRISLSEGIFDKSSVKGKPVILEISDTDITQVINQLQSPILLQGTENVLIYRYPDLAMLELKLDDVTIFREKITVFQFGAVIGKRLVLK